MDIPGRITDSHEALITVLGDGTEIPVPSRRHCGLPWSEHFWKVEDVLVQRGAIRKARFGDAAVIVCDAEMLNDILSEMLRDNPDLFSDNEPLGQMIRVTAEKSHEPEHPLPARMQQWIIDAVDPQATIVSVQRLKGGISSLVHLVSLQVEGNEVELVLRRFDNEEWLRHEPDLAAHEAESLRYAARTGVPTPRIVAFDREGNQSGIPCVLMTRLEGVVDLKPLSMEDWLDKLAATLVRIHAVNADEYPWAYYSYNNATSLDEQTWSKVPELWNAAFDIAKGPRPDYKPCFIHRDYHPTNILWKDNEVSGVVDWVNACRGPAGADVGHCRWNLTMLYGVKTADAFLAAYERHAGAAFQYDPYWDLVSLIDVLYGPPTVYEGWPACGKTDLTDELMASRMDEYVQSLLERASGK